MGRVVAPSLDEFRRARRAGNRPDRSAAPCEMMRIAKPRVPRPDTRHVTRCCVAQCRRSRATARARLQRSASVGDELPCEAAGTGPCVGRSRDAIAGSGGRISVSLARAGARTVGRHEPQLSGAT